MRRTPGNEGSRPRLSVVMPVYRSEAFLEQVVNELVVVLDGAFDFEVVLVNDGSPDGVQSLLVRLAAGDSRIRFLELAKNVGQHRAVLAGFRASRGQVVVTLDDDGQNPPSAVPILVGALEERDLDLVYGRFRSHAQSGWRRFVSWGHRALSRWILGNRAGVYVSQVRALRGDLARLVGGRDASIVFVDALLWRATARIGDVQIDHRPRVAGRSAYSLAKLVKLELAEMLTDPRAGISRPALALLELFLAFTGLFVVLGVAGTVSRRADEILVLGSALLSLAFLALAGFGYVLDWVAGARATPYVRSTSESGRGKASGEEARPTGTGGR